MFLLESAKRAQHVLPHMQGSGNRGFVRISPWSLILGLQPRLACISRAQTGEGLLLFRVKRIADQL
jgi:hypothetical protein